MPSLLCIKGLELKRTVSCVRGLELCVLNLTQLDKKWEQKVEEAIKERTKETQDDSSQTDTLDSATQLLSLEQLEDRLSAQRMALERESESKLSKAVEEAVRGKERELQQKHVQDMALQVCLIQHLISI